MTSRGLGVVAVLAIAPAPAAAQFTAALDLGAGTTRSDDAFSGAVATLAPSLAFETGGLRLGASGAYSNGPSGRWNFLGNAAGALTSPRFGPVALEANANLGWTWHEQVQGATVVEGGLRMWAYPSAATAIWAGATLGRGYSLGVWRPLRRVQVGTTAHLGPVRLGLSLTSTAFDIATTPGGSIAAAAASADTVPATPVGPGFKRNTFTDGLVSGRLTLAAVDLDVAMGRRFSRNTPELTLWSVLASRSLTPQLALVAGAGRSATDPVTALPGSRYVVFGMRVQFRPAQAPRQASEPRLKRDERILRIGPAGPDGREIRLRTPGARSVELAGDFTDWLPMELERRGNDWVGRVAIPPGIHRVAVRVDGGPWGPPPGTRPVESEFGPDVGEIVVE
jgi:hypothetical protein